MDGDGWRLQKTVTSEMKWAYLDEQPSKQGMHGYNGPGPCLKNFTSNCFNDPLEACAVARGLTEI